MRTTDLLALLRTERVHGWQYVRLAACKAKVNRSELRGSLSCTIAQKAKAGVPQENRSSCQEQGASSVVLQHSPHRPGTPRNAAVCFTAE